MNIKKIAELNKIKERLIALSLAACISISVTGCKNNDKKEQTTTDEMIGYQIEKEKNIYNYILDRNKIKIEDNDNERYVFAKITNQTEYNTNEQSTDFYQSNLLLIWPENYKTYDPKTWVTTDNFECKYSYKTLQDINGKNYYVINSEIIAKEDLINTENKIKKNKIIKKGDSIYSITIYDTNGKLVGYEQQGIGNNNQNVKNAKIGDPNSFAISLTAAGLLTEKQNINSTELIKIQNEINEKPTKKLTK